MSCLASVIVPCYNVESYLASALMSILSQTITDLEVIAVDDGSKDNTTSILKDFAARDTRIRLITQPNRGVSAARNRGLENARGRYIFFVDPDDTVHPEMIARCITRLEETKADCCIFAYQRRFGEEDVWHTMPLQGCYEYSSTQEIITDFFPHMFGYSDDQARIWGQRGEWRAGREEGGVWRWAYRREIIQQANVRFDETIVLYEDAMFNCEYLLAAKRMTCLDDVLYNYTVRPQGAVTAHNRTGVLFTNKVRLLEKRKELDARTNGRLWPLYSASCVFSILEMLHALIFTNARTKEVLPIVLSYIKDAATRRALQTFPLPTRRPLVAVLIWLMRLYSRINQ